MSSSEMHAIHLPTLAVSVEAANGNLHRRGGLHSPDALNHKPDHHLPEIRSQPFNAGASTPNTVIGKENSAAKAVNSVRWLSSPQHDAWERVRCRSLIGDRRKPTQSCKRPKPLISRGSFFAVMPIIEKITAKCRGRDRCSQ